MICCEPWMIQQVLCGRALVRHPHLLSEFLIAAGDKVCDHTTQPDATRPRGGHNGMGVRTKEQ